MSRKWFTRVEGAMNEDDIPRVQKARKMFAAMLELTEEIPKPETPEEMPWLTNVNVFFEDRWPEGLLPGSCRNWFTVEHGGLSSEVAFPWVRPGQIEQIDLDRYLVHCWLDRAVGALERRITYFESVDWKRQHGPYAGEEFEMMESCLDEPIEDPEDDVSKGGTFGIGSVVWIYAMRLLSEEAHVEIGDRLVQCFVRIWKGSATGKPELLPLIAIRYGIADESAAAMVWEAVLKR